MSHPSVNETILGIIGTGAMGEALLRGILSRGLIAPERVVAYDIRTEHLMDLCTELGIRAATESAEVARSANVIVLAVKPQHIHETLAAIRSHVDGSRLVVSIAAGVGTAAIEASLPGAVPVVRVMPNTPALVGKGVSVISLGTHATDEHRGTVTALLASVGSVISVDEALLDAVTGLSGSGPAYVCLMVEALADGGVAEGLPRDVALRLAAETVRGTGELLCQALAKGEHPAVVRERVTSPAGTTAAGLAALERAAVRAAFSEAVREASARSKELGDN